MSREQYEWLERRGVSDVWLYDYLGQDNTHVFLIRRDIGLRINRRKEIAGWVF